MSTPYWLDEKYEHFAFFNAIRVWLSRASWDLEEAVSVIAGFFPDVKDLSAVPFRYGVSPRFSRVENGSIEKELRRYKRYLKKVWSSNNYDLSPQVPHQWISYAVASGHLPGWVELALKEPQLRAFARSYERFAFPLLHCVEIGFAPLTDAVSVTEARLFGNIPSGSRGNGQARSRRHSVLKSTSNQAIASSETVDPSPQKRGPQTERSLPLRLYLNSLELIDDLYAGKGSTLALQFRVSEPTVSRERRKRRLELEAEAKSPKVAPK